MRFIHFCTCQHTIYSIKRTFWQLVRASTVTIAQNDLEKFFYTRHQASKHLVGLWEGSTTIDHALYHTLNGKGRHRVPCGENFLHNFWQLISQSTEVSSIEMELSLVHLLLVCCCISFARAQRESLELLVHPLEDYPLPNLPFSYEDLEPFLDTPTLKVHHLGHHRTYTDKMNAALQRWRENVRKGCLYIHISPNLFLHRLRAACQ